MHVPCPPPTRCPTTLTHYAQSQCDFRRALVQRDYFSMTYLHWLKLVKQRGLPSKYLWTCIIIIAMFCATNHAQKTALARGLIPFAMQSPMVCFCTVVFLKSENLSFNTLIVHISHVLWPIFIKHWSKVAMDQANYVTWPTWGQRSSEVN